MYDAGTVAAVVGKDTSQDKATLSSEEIMSVAPAVLELCLPEGISEYVSHAVIRNSCYSKCIYFKSS